MELGAVICRPVPKCDECPIRHRCAWQGRGDADPAVGSAAVSRPQGRFEGSERQARGRLMRSLTHRPLAVADAVDVLGHPAAERLLAALRTEGLVRVDGDVVRLP
jgi:A/G-specific adenine glycosylase